MMRAIRLKHLVVGSVATAAVCLSSCAGPADKEPHAATADSSIHVYGPYVAVKLAMSKGVPMGNPIQIAAGPGGYMYAANQTGEVYTLRDTDGDGLEDSAALYCNVRDAELRSPVGFAHRGDTVYIGTSQQIRAYLDVDGDAVADTSWMFFDRIPNSEHPYEWSSGLSFGPDGWLYVAFTTDSWNDAPAADPLGYRGAIVRISPDGKKAERMASGIRSVPGMAFHQTGGLFFVDNEGGGNPTEELNRLEVNAFYGHNKKKYPADSAKVTAPVFSLLSEVSPSAMEFNSPTNDFGGTAGDLFVAYYGPGERWSRGAVSRVVMEPKGDGTLAYAEYTIADAPKISDLAFGRDGALYLASHGKADYWYNSVYPQEGCFYKITHDPASKVPGNYVRPKPGKVFSKDAIEMGRQLFAESACLGCHQVDGTTELLGPNLKDIAKFHTRAEILAAITDPSKQIKPSMMGVLVTMKDGRQFLGRLTSSSENELQLMLIGNRTVTLQRADIARTEDQEQSLMYEGLVSRMSEEQVNALLDYLVSLSQ